MTRTDISSCLQFLEGKDKTFLPNSARFCNFCAQLPQDWHTRNKNAGSRRPQCAKEEFLGTKTFSTDRIKVTSITTRMELSDDTVFLEIACSDKDEEVLLRFVVLSVHNRIQFNFSEDISKFHTPESIVDLIVSGLRTIHRHITGKAKPPPYPHESQTITIALDYDHKTRIFTIHLAYDTRHIEI